MEALNRPQIRIIQFLTNNKHYLREPCEPDRLFTKGRKIEVVYVVVSKNLPLFRTEGGGDVTEFIITTEAGRLVVPVIMPEKIQAKMRRRMIEILREHGVSKEILKMYKDLGYTVFAKNEKEEITGWNCYIAPPTGERKGMDIGMCGYCPSCNILGVILSNTVNEKVSGNSIYGIKSRAVHDPAFSVVEHREAVVELTHNKVGEGLSYTGGALFTEPHVLPGVSFIGRTVLYDVTKREAKLILSTLSSINRLGGGETKYGTVQVVIVGLKSGDRETVSSFDIARRVIEQTRGKLTTPEQVVKLTAEYLKKKGFTIVVDETKPIDELDTYIEFVKDKEQKEEKQEEKQKENLIEKLWIEDNYFFAKQVVEYIEKVQGRRESKKKSGSRSGGESEEK